MAGDDDQARAEAFVAGLAHPDDQRAAASARGRSRRRWQQQLAAESSTLAGVLLTLAERRESVTLGCGPWVHAGVLRNVTEGLTVVDSQGDVVLVATGAVSWVESAVDVADDRPLGPGPDLVSALTTLAAQHPSVRLQLADGSHVAGRLVDMGKDVARVRLTSTTATVRLSAITSCVLPGVGNG
jgi:hypothetical protein